MLHLRPDSVLKIFYLLSLTLLISITPQILTYRVPNPSWLWPLAWAETLLSPTVIFGILLIGAAILFAQAFWGNLRWMRILAAVAWLCLLTLQFPDGKISNNSLLWAGFAIIFVWPSGKNEKQIHQAVWAAQALTAAAYASSGVWKAKTLFVAFTEGHLLATLAEALPGSIAYGLAEGTASTDVFFHLLNRVPALASILWIMVVAFEIGTVSMLIFPRTIPFWGLAILGFHFVIALGAGPVFWSQALAVIFILLIAPFILKALRSEPE